MRGRGGRRRADSGLLLLRIDPRGGAAGLRLRWWRAKRRANKEVRIRLSLPTPALLSKSFRGSPSLERGRTTSRASHARCCGVLETPPRPEIEVR